MKKTLITLLALAGITYGDTVIFDLSNNDPNYGTYDDITIVKSGSLDSNGAATQTVTLGGANVTLKFDNGTGTARSVTSDSGANWNLGIPTDIDLGISSTDVQTLLSSSAQINAGHTKDGAYGGISNFTITGLQSGNYELVSFMGRSGGATTNTTLTLTGVEYTVTSYIYTDGAWTISDAATLGYSTANTPAAMMNVYTFSVTGEGPVKLTYTGTVSYNDGEEQGQDTDIATYQNVQFLALTKHVPEPATATLSLLALAGLAVRRRRK